MGDFKSYAELDHPRSSESLDLSGQMLFGPLVHSCFHLSYLSISLHVRCMLDVGIVFPEVSWARPLVASYLIGAVCPID